jgi:hypothetical protein
MLARCDFGCLSLRSFAPCRRLPMRTRSGFFLLHLASHSSFYDGCRAEQPYVSSTEINVGASKLGTSVNSANLVNTILFDMSMLNF